MWLSAFLSAIVRSHLLYSFQCRTYGINVTIIFNLTDNFVFHIIASFAQHGFYPKSHCPCFNNATIYCMKGEDKRFLFFVGGSSNVYIELGKYVRDKLNKSNKSCHCYHFMMFMFRGCCLSSFCFLIASI